MWVGGCGCKFYLGFINNVNSVLVKRCFKINFGFEFCVILGKLNFNIFIYLLEDNKCFYFLGLSEITYVKSLVYINNLIKISC